MLYKAILRSMDVPVYKRAFTRNAHAEHGHSFTMLQMSGWQVELHAAAGESVLLLSTSATVHVGFKMAWPDAKPHSEHKASIMGKISFAASLTPLLSQDNMDLTWGLQEHNSLTSSKVGGAVLFTPFTMLSGMHP